MAVRKLAPEELQPTSFAFTPQNEALADKELAKYPSGRQASAVIALLWRAQEQNGGWLPQKAIEAVADKLGMPAIRVMEVATFYTMFNLDPVGKYFIQFCGTTPCVLRGAGEIKKVLERRVGEERHVSADGNFSWLEVECLGACCNAPMVQINDDYFEDLTAENFERLLDDLAAGRPVKAGSQIGRRSSEPEGDVKTLHRPGPVRRLGDRRVAQAVRGRGGQARRYRRGRRGDRRGRCATEAGKAAERPRHRDRGRGYAGKTREGRRGAGQPPPSARLLPIHRRRPRSEPDGRAGSAEPRRPKRRGGKKGRSR